MGPSGTALRQATAPAPPRDSIFEPDLILPVQFHRNRGRSTADDRVGTLQLAVLELAIQDYMNATWHVSPKLLTWFQARHARGGPFAFEAICDNLGFDADAVWEALQDRRRGRELESEAPRWTRQHHAQRGSRTQVSGLRA